MKTFLPPTGTLKPRLTGISFLLIISAFILNIGSANAQSIVITGISGTPVCAGSQVNITFSAINGNGSNKYNSSSTFRVYLSNSSGVNFSLLSSFSLTASYNSSNGGTTANLITSITIPANTAGGNAYKISMGSTSPSYNSSPFTLNASSAFTINAKPTAILSGSNSICNGANTNLSLAVTGAGTISGTLSNGTPFSGTAPTIIVQVSPTVTTSYSISTLATANCAAGAADLSGSATITVNQPVAINLQPIASQSVCLGSPAGISVAATGTGTLNYQWYKGSTLISNGGRFSGANSNTLNISSVISSDASTGYHVVITDAGGCPAVTSLNSALIVNHDVSITVQPLASQTICEGNAASLQVIANGTGPFTVQWYKGANPVNTGISNTPGTNTITSMLAINAATVADAGSYYAVINSSAASCNSEISSQASIIVNAKSANPLNATASSPVICNGQSSTLTLNGGGGGSAELIRWYTSSCGGTLVGSGNNLSVSPTTTTTYYGRYENGSPCNYNSTCAETTVTVSLNPSDPVSATALANTICIGQSTTLNLIGGGGGTGEVIHWYASSCNGTAAGTGNNLSVSPSITTTYYGRYELVAPCTYTSACQHVTVTVNQKSTNPVLATASPATICAGSSSSLTISGGSPAPGSVIKWYSSSCGGTLVGSGNGLVVSPNVTTIYYGRYEDPAPCSFNSNCVQAIVTVMQPASANAGSAIELCGDAGQASPSGATAINVTTGATAANYASVLWTSSGTGTFSNAISLTLATYTPSAADKTAGTVILTLKAFGIAPCANATSTKIMTIGKTIVNAVKLTSVCATGNEVMVLIDQGSPAVSGGNGIYNYQWYFSTPGNSNFQPIAGATGATLVVSQANNNGFYRRLITSGGCSAYSNSIHVNANNAILATSFTITGGGAYCGNGGTGVPVGLSGSINGAPEFIVTYQLFRDNIYTGLSIQGTGSAITFPNQLIAGTYTIKAVLSVNGGNACSALPINGSAVISVDAPVPASVAGSNQFLCNTYSTSVSGNDPAPYAGTWTLISGTGTINTPTTAATTISGLSLGDNIFQWKISNNTCSDSSRITIHVDPQLVINSQPSEMIFCAGDNASFSVVASGININYQWMQSSDNGATYTNVINDAVFNGANNSTLNLTAVPPSMSGNLYKVHVWVNAPCNTSLESNTVSLLSKNLWMGITDSNWFTATNWSGGIVPDITCPDVHIPARSNQPLLRGATADVKNIIIEPGATLTIDNAKLRVSGNIINNGTLVASNGTVEFNGTFNQSIAANTFQNNDLLNLIISSTDTLALNGSLNIYGKISFTGVGKTFLTNDHLTLKSTAAGTASVTAIPEDATGIALDFIKGNVTVERFIPAQKAWRFLSIPTNTTQSIHEAWQENQPANSTNLSGFGIQITGEFADWAARGFDIRTPTGPSMKTFNSAINNFEGISSTYNPIKTRQGYMTIIRGDRTVNLYNQLPTTTVLRTTGALYTGKQPVISVNADEFTAVGNPFASAIDFSKISITGGVQDVFYVWDPKLSSGYGLGAYQTFIRQGAGYTVVPGGGSYGSGNTAIESGLAFLVHASGAAGTVTIAESAKVNGSHLVTRGAGSDKSLRINLSVISANNPVLLDGAMSEFDPSFANSYDNSDIVKITGQGENISIPGNNKNFVAEKRSLNVLADTVNYYVAGLQQKEYQLEIVAQDLGENGLTAFLEDRYLMTSTLLNLNGTSTQNFSVTSDPLSKTSNRFRIVFKQVQVLPVNFTRISARRNSDHTVTINWNVEQEINMEKYEVESSMDGHSFFKIGTESKNAAGNMIYELRDINPAKTELYYRVKGLSVGGQVQYSSVAKVAGIPLSGGISIYPNPVVNKIINVRFDNQAAGTYRIKLISSQGNVVYGGVVSISGLSENFKINTPDIAAGIYILEIISPDGKRTIQQAVIK